tara:strand:- start:3432 stop:3890 length:459 start_codon:yes stop_codon:yes gene_type:complete
MVVFKKHVKDSHAKEHHSWVQSIHTKQESERMELRKRSQFPVTTEVFDGLKHTYNIIGGLVGYSGHFDDETIEAIRRHPDVSPSHLLNSCGSPELATASGSAAARGRFSPQAAALSRACHRREDGPSSALPSDSSSDEICRATSDSDSLLRL